jgi:hypothetical protein
MDSPASHAALTQISRLSRPAVADGSLQTVREELARSSKELQKILRPSDRDKCRKTQPHAETPITYSASDRSFILVFGPSSGDLNPRRREPTRFRGQRPTAQAKSLNTFQQVTSLAWSYMNIYDPKQLRPLVVVRDKNNQTGEWAHKGYCGA